MAANQQWFSSRFNSQFSFGQDGELTGRFGLSVLDDLIAGIDEFWAAAARRSSRDLGPAMLGAFGWRSRAASASSRSPRLQGTETEGQSGRTSAASPPGNRDHTLIPPRQHSQGRALRVALSSTLMSLREQLRIVTLDLGHRVQQILARAHRSRALAHVPPVPERVQRDVVVLGRLIGGPVAT
jgi:hypothetical protein